MARIRVTCHGCEQSLLVWGTHDDLVVNLTAERLARSARCRTCGELLDSWSAVRRVDRADLEGSVVEKLSKT